MMIRMVLMMALLSAPFPQPGLASDIPRAAERHRAELIRVSRAVWGLEAPVAVFAAQVHTESWWRNGTVSSAGAQGLAQFLPSTACRPGTGTGGRPARAVQSRLGAPGAGFL